MNIKIFKYTFISINSYKYILISYTYVHTFFFFEVIRPYLILVLVLNRKFATPLSPFVIYVIFFELKSN